MTKFVSLDAIAETLGVHRGDAGKFLKVCDVGDVAQTRIQNEECDGRTVKGWELDGILDVCERAVTDWSEDQERYLRNRAVRSWRHVKLGFES